MTEMFCIYDGDRDQALIAHLYDDGDRVERAGFDAHLAGCAVCRAEVAELEAVRAQLASWAPPEPVRALAHGTPPLPSPRPDAWATLRGIPAWAQVAAALLCVGVGAGIANLDIRYDASGLAVRTGWMSAQPAPGNRAPALPTGVPATADAPAWRADIAALEEQLRAEFRAATTATARPVAAASGPSADDLLRRVQGLVEQSERRQQRELALRVGELLRDVQTQRTADLVRIDRTLGYIQNGTGAEVMRQRRMLNDLAVRVTQRQ